MFLSGPPFAGLWRLKAQGRIQGERGTITPPFREKREGEKSEREKEGIGGGNREKE